LLIKNKKGNKRIYFSKFVCVKIVECGTGIEPATPSKKQISWFFIVLTPEGVVLKYLEVLL
jgi:hypothetical protein